MRIRSSCLDGAAGRPRAGAAQTCTSDARQVVTAVYRQVLERSPNGTEANSWVNRFGSGRSGPTVASWCRRIAASAEHKQRFLANGSEAGRRQGMATLYRHLLGREADAGGLEANLQLARRDMDEAISSFISSPEYQQKFGEQAVPGQGVRYCGAQYNSAANNSWFRFRSMDRNGNGVIERKRVERQQPVVQLCTTGIVTACCRTAKCARGPALAERRRRLRIRTDRPRGRPAPSRRIDRNNDGRIVPTSVHTGPEYFRRADRDRNGVLVAHRNSRTTGSSTTIATTGSNHLDMNNNSAPSGASGTAATRRSRGSIAITTTC